MFNSKVAFSPVATQLRASASAANNSILATISPESFSKLDHLLGDSSFLGSDVEPNIVDIENFDKVKPFVLDFGRQRLDDYSNVKRWYGFVEKNYDSIDRTPIFVAPEMSIDEKYELISRNLQEVLGEDRIKKVLSERDLRVYWGTATTGRPHIAYFVPMCKIADLLNAGCEVTILLADLHGYLDNMKAPWELIGKRANYYKFIITEMLKAINVPIEKLKFVQGTDYQLSKEYTLDVYKLSSMVTEHDAKKAGAQVVKQVDSPLLSGLLYPLLQGLDEQYLGVDCQFGGIDQRKIFTFAEEYMPKLGYKKCSHLMNRMVPGLTGDKMSSSVADSKIDLLDSAKDVTRKIKKAFCEEGNVEQNGLLAFCDAVLFPIYGEIRISRKEEFGGDLHYTSFEAMKADFAAKNLHPGDLKNGVASTINKLLDPIRKSFQDKDKLAVMHEAYPEFAPKKAGKGGKGGAPAKKGPPQAAPITPGRLNIRVGHITKVEAHPNSEKLYIETVNFGEEIGQRTILSGLGGSGVTMSDLDGSKRPFLINLKPVKLGGIESQGMLLCASKNRDGGEPGAKDIGLLTCPESAIPGEKVLIEGFEKQEADERLNPKKKVWETLAPDFKVDDEGNCQFKDSKMVLASQEQIISEMLKGASIS